MMKVAAIFEHGVFRPVEPVHIRDGARVELSFEALRAGPARASEVTIAMGSHGLPVIVPPPDSRSVTSEDVARGLEDS